MTANTTDRTEADANILATAKLAIEELQGSDYRTRRRGVMFVATLLGHKMGVEELSEEPWGTVGQCANCGQIGKAPREGTTIEGRAVTTLCPAGGKR